MCKNNYADNLRREGTPVLQNNTENAWTFLAFSA
jgi:hypothetical protein